MPRLEILHHIARLEGAGLGDGAGDEVDDDGVRVGGGGEEGEDELGELGDAGDGVEVCFAEGADAHEGEEEGDGEGQEGEGEGDEGAEDDVRGGGAEDEGEEEAAPDEAGGDEVVGWCVGFWGGGGGGVSGFEQVVVRGLGCESCGGGSKGGVAGFGGGEGGKSTVIAVLQSRAKGGDELGPMEDDGPENEPAEVDDGVCKHDCKANPDNPAFTAGFPFADGAGGPAFGFGEGGEDAPAGGGAEEHVEGCGGAHDDALAYVGRGGVEGPEPVAGEGEAEDGDVVEGRDEVGCQRLYT